MFIDNFWSWLALASSSTFFSGFLPGKALGKPGKAGGTAGAAMALLVQFLLADRSSVWAIIALTVGSFAVGWFVVGPAERFMLSRWGRRQRHTGETVSGDFNETNIDEFHGQLLAGLPLWLLGSGTQVSIAMLIVSFICFRVFDTWKPWPVGAVEDHYKGSAFGIMIDDTVAAALAAAIVIPLSLFFS